jgi:hypothetical protein
VIAKRCGPGIAILCAIGLGCGTSTPLAAQDRSVGEIVARCADAMGLGPEAQRLQTLRFVVRPPTPPGRFVDPTGSASPAMASGPWCSTVGGRPTSRPISDPGKERERSEGLEVLTP